MKTAAVVVDAIGLIPFAGTFVDPIATIGFGIWFSHHDESMVRKRPLAFFLTAAAEFFPFVDMLPWWSILVWRTLKKNARHAV